MKNIVSYGFIKKYVKDAGYELITTENEYINTKFEIVVRCPNGHEYKVKWHHFKKGGRCAKCRNLAKHTLDEVRKYAEQRGYIILSQEYKDNKNVCCKIKVPKVAN